MDMRPYFRFLRPGQTARFQLRRTVFRALTSQPSSFLTKSRSFATITPSVLRFASRPTSIAFPRRWASGESESKRFNEEAPPITAEEPTPQEQVEDQIHSDNAADHSGSAAAINDAAASSDTDPVNQSAKGSRTETSPSVSTPGDESTSKINEAISSMKGTVSSVADSIADTARNVTGMRRNDAKYSDDESDSSATRSSSRSLRGSSYRTTSPRGSSSSASSSTGALVEPKSTIYIGNLFFDVTENDLVKELSRFGNVTKCRLIRDSRGLSKGFGYVDFETIASATKAIEALHQQLFEGRRLAVQYAAYSSRQLDTDRSGFPRADRPQKPLNPPSETLFIGNMSFEMTDRDLNALFRSVKNVIDVRVAIDRRTGQPRGFAHADFIDVKSAMEGMKVLETKETYGRKLRLDFSYGASSAARNRFKSSDKERSLKLDKDTEEESNN